MKKLGSLAIVATLAMGGACATAAVGASEAHAATTYKSYTVKSGDTLTKIARANGTTVKAIASASGIKNVNYLKIGQKLKIPYTTTSKPVTTKPVTTKPVTTKPVNTVIEKRVIGTSTQGRTITAYLIGDPNAKVTNMVIGNMHGDEPKSDDTAYAMINGPQVKGIKVWVIPTINPDGLARGTRTNARGVDINRNFSYSWIKTPKDRYYGGPSAMSEIESRNIYNFVKTVKPKWIVSIHQPLNGIDNADVKDRTLQQNLAKYTGLPIHKLGKGSVSHGTMVDCINKTTSSAAITIEYTSNPTKYQTNTKYRIDIVKALGGSY